MHKRVVVKAMQGVSETDYDRIGTYPQLGIELTTRDLLASGIFYAGFNVSKVDGTNLQIATGRVYDAGRQFASEMVEARTIADYVPVTAGQSVICLVIGQGQEVSDDVSERYYRRPIDPQNPEAGSQQTVEDDYRIKNRKAVLTIVPGIQGARPVAPSAPVGSVAVAEILVTTSGIDTITMRQDTAVTRLEAAITRLKTLEQALVEVRQSVEGLRADQAGIRAELRASASKTALAALQVDMALTKDRLDIGDDGSPYWADRFLDYTETDYDPVAATGHPDFDALVEEGIRFPHAAIDAFPLSLYNPNDPNLMHAADGLICPKYSAVDGIAVATATGEMALGGLSVQAITVEHMVEKRERIRYGTSKTICNNKEFWKSGKYDPIAGIFTAANGDTYKAGSLLVSGSGSVNHQMVRLQQFWTDTIDVPYDKFTASESTINGVVKAQSFLMHQERWTPRTWLGVKRWGEGAEITAVLLEYGDDGDPDFSRVLATVTRAAADFKTWPERTYFPFDKPRFLAPIAGANARARQYGIAYFVTGDVDVATADGDKSYLGGNLQTTSDGYTWDVDLTRDLCFGVDFCSFDITQMPIRLQGWSLTGGIVDIDILAPVICPSAANYQYEINVGGTWRALSAETSDSDFINGVTAYYDARVVLRGTEWGMPMLEMGDSRIRLTRPKAVLCWVGPGDEDEVDGWALGEDADEITLRAEVGAWDPARHTLTAKMLSGADFETETAGVLASTRVVPGREVGRPDQESAVVMEWTFTPVAPVNTVKFRFDGTTNNHRIPFHVEMAAGRKSA